MAGDVDAPLPSLRRKMKRGNENGERKGSGREEGNRRKVNGVRLFPGAWRRYRMEGRFR